MGAISRLDSFYRTHLLLLDQSNIFNSATNFFFSPLQHVFGQNSYCSFEGKVTHILQPKTPASDFLSFSTVKKVVIWVGAFFLMIVFTPCGTATRWLSFRSSDVDRAYTVAKFIRLSDEEFDRMRSELPEDLFELAKEARNPSAVLNVDDLLSSLLAFGGDPEFSSPPTTPSLEPHDPTEPQVPSLEFGGVDGVSLPPSAPPTMPSIEMEPKEPFVTAFIGFLKRLDEQLNQHPDDASAIDAWLQAEVSKKDYPCYFYTAKRFLYDLYMEGSSNHAPAQHLYDSCEQRLKNLNLNRYLDERPAPEVLEQQKKEFQTLKKVYSQVIVESLLILRPLFEALKKLTGPKESDRRTMEAWLAATKKNFSTNYNDPFHFAPCVLYRRDFFTDHSDQELLKELDKLYTHCRQQLLDLGLKRHVEERPLTVEIAQAIQNLSALASQELIQHLRFYLKKYPAIVEGLFHPKMLAEWKAAFNSEPEKAPSCPTSEAVKTVMTFYLELCKKMKVSDEAAVGWLKEQTSLPTYCFPFYYSTYWLTFINLEEDNKFKLVSEFHKKVIPWLNKQAEVAYLISEMPSDQQQGLCLLVHAIAEKAVLSPILPQAAAPSAAPVQSLVPDHSQVDDARFKTIITELLPHMAPLLEDKAMFTYWKNSLLDRALAFCVNIHATCNQIQLGPKTKKAVDDFLQQLLQLPDSTGTVTLLSRDYVKVIDKLAPLLPPPAVKGWREAYTQCSQLLENLSATEYLTAKALPFLGDAYPLEKQISDERKEVVKFFTGLIEEKDGIRLSKKITDNPFIKERNFKPFWFAREFKALCDGYQVKPSKKEKKEIERLFETVKERLTQSNLQHLLAEKAPSRNFLVLQMLGVTVQIIEKLKKDEIKCTLSS